MLELESAYTCMYSLANAVKTLTSIRIQTRVFVCVCVHKLTFALANTLYANANTQITREPSLYKSTYKQAYTLDIELALLS